MKTRRAPSQRRCPDPVSSPFIEPARITWRGDAPFSEDFDDIYYAEDGEREVHRVFFGPAGIFEQGDPKGQWRTVAELGFGSGLNFALCTERVLASAQGKLHFISFEAHPLAPADWQRLAELRPHLSMCQALAERPLPLLRGWHRRQFAQGRIQLSVYHGQALEGLKDFVQRQLQPVDAWFLDGFTPSKNPQMWRPEIFQRIAEASRQGTSITTFTAAGDVRRRLQGVGFEMDKVDQRPFKRHSLCGFFRGPSERPTLQAPSEIWVLGAGVAGCTVARQLAELDISVRLYDPAGVAKGGSKMDASALHCRLLGDGSPAGGFRVQAFHHALAALGDYSACRHSGAIQLALKAEERHKLERIHDLYFPEAYRPTLTGHWLRLLNNQELHQELGLNAQAGLLFPHARVVNLKQLCGQLIDHPRIEFIEQRAPARHDMPSVIASASASVEMTQVPLEIGDVHGQLDWIKPTTAHVPLPIVGNGYTIPNDDSWTIGSSYEYRPWAPEDASAENVARNRRFIGQGDIHLLRHRRAARCVSSDREPVIGRLDERTWITTAHGSMGTSSAPFAAAIIASDLLGWLPPIAPEVAPAISPQRFIARQARRGIKYVGPKP